MQKYSCLDLKDGTVGILVSHIVSAVLFLLCRLEREEDVESFLPPESLTFDVRVETDPRQVQNYYCNMLPVSVMILLTFGHALVSVGLEIILLLVPVKL